ncbi:MAG TPA: response regulator [Verrucomicrobiae bacterium]|nr:response regulator [Verrucomicrobiae bacterium]
MTAKILIVDDEESVRGALGKVLRAEGYDIVLAGNGQLAIEKVAQEPIDLVLLDLGLPVKDGWALLKWLPRFSPLLPVIVITGRWKQAEMAEAAGADILMEKPLDVTKLLENIRQLLEEPVEARAKRIRDRKRAFKSVGCDQHQFRASLESRFTTPFKWFGLKRNQQ